MKVYITRDEDSNQVWIWKNPIKGNWIPYKLPGCQIVNWQRESMNETRTYACYDIETFEKKFGILIKEKECKKVDIVDSLLNFENDKERLY